ncbi:MAG: hypothetical protein RLO81_01290 [Fulvivirga sp.]|uniref:hypothetical protein n=1 Tax=Fulvivirga sp. TaxID=1931237 RepID=UPI0032EC62FA
MKLFLNVKIIENSYDFKPGLTFQNVICTDLDNYSSPEVVATALKAIEVSDSLFAYFELCESSHSGSILKVIQVLISYKHPLQINYSGKSDSLEKLVSRLGGKPIKKDELEPAISSFFS